MSFPQWHRYLLAFLMAFLALSTAVATGVVAVPPALLSVAPYAGLVVVFLTAFLPKVQDNSGPPTLPKG